MEGRSLGDVKVGSHTNLTLLEIRKDDSPKAPEKGEDSRGSDLRLMPLNKILLFFLAQKETIEVKAEMDHTMEVIKHLIEQLVDRYKENWDQLLTPSPLFYSLGGWKAMVLKVHQIAADALFCKSHQRGASARYKLTNMWETVTLQAFMSSMHENVSAVLNEIEKTEKLTTDIPEISVKMVSDDKDELTESYFHSGQPEEGSYVVTLNINMLWYAVQCTGRFDIYLTGFMAKELSEMWCSVSGAGLLWSDFNLAKNVGDVAQRLFTKGQESRRMSESQYMWHERMLSQRGSIENLQRSVADVADDLYFANMNPQDLAARRRLKKLLVYMQGHADESIRSLAVIMLNAFCDTHNFQMSEKNKDGAFMPFTDVQISAVDEELELHIPADGISSEAFEGKTIVLQLVGLPLIFAEGVGEKTYETMTSHVINCQTQTIKFGKLSRAGIYDWRIVEICPVGDEAFRPILNATTGQALKGRIIAQPRGSRQLVTAETFVDQQGAVWDHDANLKQRGNFRSCIPSIQDLSEMGVNTLFLGGALARDNGKTSIDPLTGGTLAERPDASPFAVTCRASPCDFLGGESGFRELINAANMNNMRLTVDCQTRVSSTRRHRKYRDLLLYQLDDSGKKNLLYGTVGRGIRQDESCLLNYRISSAWDIMEEDVVALARIHGVGGVRLEDAHLWPPILPIDEDELQRKDPDNETHYSDEEVLSGYIVRGDGDFRKVGFWNTSARKAGYANPMIMSLTRALWRHFPDFLFLGECSDLSGENARTLSISGIIPQVTSLPQVLAPSFGKTLTLEGKVVNTDMEPVSVQKTLAYLNLLHKRLPKGCVSLMSSCSPNSPLPALLYDRGSWPFVDILLFLESCPVVQVCEMKGSAYRLDAANFFAQRGEAPQAPAALGEDFPMIRGGEAAGGHIFKPMARAVSLCGVVELDRVNSMETQHKQALKDQHFDLAAIENHYKHRLLVRRSFRVLNEGTLVTIKLPPGPGDKVMVFARVLQRPPQEDIQRVVDVNKPGVVIAIIAANISDSDVDVSVPLSATIFEQVLQSYGCDICMEVDMLQGVTKRRKDKTDVPWSISEITSTPLDITIPAFGCVVKGIVPHKKPLSNENVNKLLISSIERKGGKFFVESLSRVLRPEASIEAFEAFLERLQHVGYLSRLLPLTHQWPKERFSDQLRATFISRLRRLQFNDSKAGELVRECLQSNRLGQLMFVTPELGKWSTVGGLGVMVDELTTTLASSGLGNQEIAVVSPYYELNRKGEKDYLTKGGDSINWIFNIEVFVGVEKVTVGVFYGRVNEVDCYFLHNGKYFPKPYPHFDARMMIAFLSLMGKAPLQLCCSLGKVPSTIVTNDWASGFCAAYAKNQFFGDTFNGTKFFHIVHNLNESYEGRIYFHESDKVLRELCHITERDLLVDPLWKDCVVNPSRCALLASDNWGTVSPTYKRELLEGSALSPILRCFASPFAHPNGIPLEPRLKRIAALNLSSHEEAKIMLQKKYFGFDNGDLSIPIFAFVGRITEQKGVNLIADAAEQLIRRYNHRVQILVGGMRNPGEAYSDRNCYRLKDLHRQFPYNFWANPDMFFTDGPLVNYGADFGLMPSVFEPGGIVQQEFFVAGTPVLAFRTGGLKDTVSEYSMTNKEGNGFTFEAHSISDFMFAMDRAIKLFSTDVEEYETLRVNARNSVVTGDVVASAWLGEFSRIHGKAIINESLVEAADRLYDLAVGGDSDSSMVDLTVHVGLKDEDASDGEDGDDADYGYGYDSPTGDKKAHAMDTWSISGTSTTAIGKEKRKIEISFNPRGNQLFLIGSATVQLAGSFDGWQSRQPMNWIHELHSWETCLKLYPGKYQYKIVADGVWMVDAAADKEVDELGNINNVFVVTDK